MMTELYRVSIDITRDRFMKIKYGGSKVFQNGKKYFSNLSVLYIFIGLQQLIFES